MYSRPSRTSRSAVRSRYDAVDAALEREDVLSRRLDDMSQPSGVAVCAPRERGASAVGGPG